MIEVPVILIMVLVLVIQDFTVTPVSLSNALMTARKTLLKDSVIKKKENVSVKMDGKA
jgi:hypothetical protein